MQLFKLTYLSLVLVMVLGSCAGSLGGDARPVSANYCDNFMIYDMCARDTNRDGVVDFVYFEDTQEVFMYRPGMGRRIPRNLGRHQCAMEMDEDLVATTSRLLYIDDETPFFEKQDIRGSMMIKYIAYMPRVTACNMRAEQAAESGS
ncbi:MAG: hypothetical protein ACE37N_07560 [Pseudohongiellaceae bacterium]|jgi:hypothetical protein